MVVTEPALLRPGATTVTGLLGGRGASKRAQGLTPVLLKVVALAQPPSIMRPVAAFEGADDDHNPERGQGSTS